MVHSRRCFVAGLSTLVVATLSKSARATTAEVLAGIRTARQRLQTLQARFSQERSLALLATKVVSRGELCLVRPDKLRWEILPPDAITWWVTPSGLAYLSPRSRGSADRSAAGNLGAVLDDLLVVLGGDPATLAQRYDLTASLQGDESARVVAVPKDARVAAVVQSLEVILEKDLISPRQIVLEEHNSDRLKITFQNVRLNQPIDPDKMRPPPQAR